MGTVVNVKLYEFARKELNCSEEKATEFVQTIQEVIKSDMKQEGFSDLATRSFVKEEIHRVELSLTKAIFWSGLVQFLAIVGSVVAIINFVGHR